MLQTISSARRCKGKRHQQKTDESAAMTRRNQDWQMEHRLLTQHTLNVPRLCQSQVWWLTKAAAFTTPAVISKYRRTHCNHFYSSCMKSSNHISSGLWILKEDRRKTASGQHLFEKCFVFNRPNMSNSHRNFYYFILFYFSQIQPTMIIISRVQRVSYKTRVDQTPYTSISPYMA